MVRRAHPGVGRGDERLAAALMSVDLNLPPRSATRNSRPWRAFSRACRELGIAEAVTGHTARYDGCAWPMVGGDVHGVRLCRRVRRKFRDGASGRPRGRDQGGGDRGDRVVRGDVSATARRRVGADVARAADALFEEMTVVPEARVASDFGLRERADSMHDATEGGVIGGLSEVAAASEVGLRIDLGSIPVRPEVRSWCDYVGIDPYSPISEGTLIATVARDRADAFVAALGAARILAAVVGEVTDAASGRVLVTSEGSGRCSIQASIRSGGPSPAGRARRLAQPGLDDRLAEVVAVSQALRLRLPALAREDRDRNLGDPCPVSSASMRTSLVQNWSC